MEEQSQTNLMSRVHPLELDLVMQMQMQMQQKHHHYQYCTVRSLSIPAKAQRSILQYLPAMYSTDAIPYQWVSEELSFKAWSTEIK